MNNAPMLQEGEAGCSSTSVDPRERIFGPTTPIGLILANVPNQVPGSSFSTRVATALRFFQGQLPTLQARYQAQQDARASASSANSLAAVLYSIANLAEIQHRESFKSEDLDLSISTSVEGIKLLPDGHPQKAMWLPFLVYLLEKRARASDNLEDVDDGIRYGHQALSCSSEASGFVLGLMRDLSALYLRKYETLNELVDLEESIQFGQNALSVAPNDWPGLPELAGSLGTCYLRRSHRLGTPEDLDKSGMLIERALQFRPDFPARHLWLANLGTVYRSLFKHFGRDEDVEKAIVCYHRAVSRAEELQDLSLPGVLSQLGMTYQVLFSRTQKPEHIESAVNYQKKAAELTPDGHPHKPRILCSLGQVYGVRSSVFHEPEDFDRERAYYEQAMELGDDEHLDRSILLYSLGGWHYANFGRTGDKESIDAAVRLLEQAWSLHPANSSEHRFSLGLIYQARGGVEDVERARDLFKQAAQDQTGTPAFRLSSAKEWAKVCPDGSDTKFEAYAYAITVLLPLTIWIGVSTDRRHESLVFDVKDLVAAAVASAVSAGRYDAAVEWFEQGHAIVWRQTLQLRTPLDDVYAADAQLATELGNVSRELEIASSKKATPDRHGRLIERSSLDEAQQHRRLAQRREELVDAIRRLPGFEDFLRPPTARKLLSGIRDGTVVIVNLYRDQCDALILVSGSEDIIHVRLSAVSHSKVESAHAKLLRSIPGQGARRGVVSSKSRPVDTFRDVLGTLWRDIVKPIVVQMGITHIPTSGRLPHITWCTAGTLSFLPLHAAGDYGNIETIGDYERSNAILSNLAVSSYAPTINVLSPRAFSSDVFSGILAVGHGSAIRDSKRSLNPLPSTKDELDQIESRVKNWRFTRLEDSNARGDEVLDAMRTHSWVHFACHGSQDLTSPMDSALHLHDKDITLEAISRHPLPHAQLAFLSACETATGNSILPDEGLHLAAGLLMAGYPTVIATMWSIGDRDAPIVAGNVYERLLEDGIPDSRKAARALHEAVARLRSEIGVDQFARWVSHVHIGQ
ncbi:hypothetical protein FRC09_011301 [Ceratobasidium sp. 395]|nr:hypothetical protein FRC09_011301 [Ceratobasidium sp. 395]